MNSFEILSIVLGCFLSFQFGRVLFRYIGWWAQYPRAFLVSGSLRCSSSYWGTSSSASTGGNVKELSSSRWITAKGVLFLILGLLSGTLLLLEHLSVRAGLLLALTVWSFCRFYYFAFHAI